MTTAAGRFTAIDALPANEPVAVYQNGSLATLYATKNGGTTVANPVTTDSFGTLSFFAVPGDFQLTFAVGDVDRTITITVPADPSLAWPG